MSSLFGARPLLLLLLTLVAAVTVDGPIIRQHPVNLSYSTSLLHLDQSR